MSWNVYWLLFVAIPSADQPRLDGAYFDNYYRASEVARSAGKPILVILNPGPQGEGNAISLADVRKTRERRGLLKNYVVVVIDTTTSHGRVVHRAYHRPKLPHVAVIGREQNYEIFDTSETLYGQRWTEILTTYRQGVRIVRPRAAAYCST